MKYTFKDKTITIPDHIVRDYRTVFNSEPDEQFFDDCILVHYGNQNISLDSVSERELSAITVEYMLHLIDRHWPSMYP